VVPGALDFEHHFATRQVVNDEGSKVDLGSTKEKHMELLGLIGLATMFLGFFAAAISMIPKKIGHRLTGWLVLSWVSYQVVGEMCNMIVDGQPTTSTDIVIAHIVYGGMYLLASGATFGLMSGPNHDRQISTRPRSNTISL